MKPAVTVEAFGDAENVTGQHQRTRDTARRRLFRVNAQHAHNVVGYAEASVKIA